MGNRETLLEKLEAVGFPEPERNFREKRQQWEQLFRVLLEVFPEAVEVDSASNHSQSGN